ncbi:hypothetical protein MAR_021102 [Mya arenaria]|uniref:Reverse transcriptase RNase H-like domain-containing protein n=1 Tax=Mya arenaria TaxID=6604 RepID=A0ABY7E6R1_MYAAR|nr:hypothetical protein MAR_021102 [Mya arenaria]
MQHVQFAARTWLLSYEYGSRSLTAAEINQTNIERGMTATLYAVHVKFHQHLYGKNVIVQSDHRPVEMIFSKPLIKAPSRLQC